MLNSQTRLTYIIVPAPTQSQVRTIKTNYDNLSEDIFFFYISLVVQFIVVEEHYYSTDSSTTFKRFFNSSQRFLNLLNVKKINTPLDVSWKKTTK